MKPHDRPGYNPQPTTYKSHRGFNRRGAKTHKSKEKK